MKLSLKPIRASRAPGFQGHYGGSQLVLTLYRMHFFCFQMCNRLPEMMKNGDAGIFPVYYSLKAVVNTVGGLLASRRVFSWLPLVFFLFLFDRSRLNHLLKHANKKKSRDVCCSVPVTYKTVVTTL